MEFSWIGDNLGSLQGEYGVVVARARTGEIIAAHNEENWFPLASAAKLAIGVAVAKEVVSGKAQWSDRLEGVRLDPKEDSDVLYPHMQGLTEYELQEVVEVMIACHDHCCAQSLALFNGGWSVLQTAISDRFRGIKISDSPRDTENNVGTPHDLFKLMLEVVDGYRKSPHSWKPIVAGLLRQRDKAEGVPAHQVFNLTGGLPNNLIDVGIIGSLTGEAALIYVIAGKNLPDRQSDQVADEVAASIVRRLYENLTKR